MWAAVTSAAEHVYPDFHTRDTFSVLHASGKDTPDSTLSLDTFSGNVIYLDFWASWCTPCLQAMPFLDTLQKQYGEEGFTVIAVNVDEDKSSAVAFLKKLPVSYPVIRDPDNTLISSADFIGLPTGYLIDYTGKTILRQQGFTDRDKTYLRAVIEKAIAEKAFESQ